MIESSLTHRGFRYHYQLFGGTARRRAPILFIGGAFQTMRSLHKFAEIFSLDADVILVDLPGSGASDALPAEYGGEFLAQCVEHLLDHLQLSRANLVGVSFGSVADCTQRLLTPARGARKAIRSPSGLICTDDRWAG